MSTARDYLAELKRDAIRFDYCTLIVFVKHLTYGVASDDPKALAKLNRLLARGGQAAGIMGYRLIKGISGKVDEDALNERQLASMHIVKTVNRDYQWDVQCVVLNGADMQRLERLAQTMDYRTDLCVRGFWCGSVEKGFADFGALERRNPGVNFWLNEQPSPEGCRLPAAPPTTNANGQNGLALGKALQLVRNNSYGLERSLQKPPPKKEHRT